jgi:hypothetical protein
MTAMALAYSDGCNVVGVRELLALPAVAAWSGCGGRSVDARRGRDALPEQLAALKSSASAAMAPRDQLLDRDLPTM